MYTCSREKECKVSLMEGLEAFQRCWHGLERWSDTPTDSQQSNTFDLLLLVVPHGAAFLFFFFPLPLCRRDSTELKAARAHALCPPPLLPHFPSHTHIHTQIIIIITSSPSSSRRSQRTQKKLLFCFEPFPPPLLRFPRRLLGTWKQYGRI